MSRDRRGPLTIILLVLGFAGTGWLMWLASPSGGSPRQVSATVQSIAPGVQPKGDSAPLQAVIALRTDDGEQIVVKRPVECIPTVRQGDQLDLRGTPTNSGGVQWQLVADRCPR